jgi:hypothetical protein
MNTGIITGQDYLQMEQSIQMTNIKEQEEKQLLQEIIIQEERRTWIEINNIVADLQYHFQDLKKSLEEVKEICLKISGE